MHGLGRTTWVIPGGRIPLGSTGPEPERTSRDELFFLNTGDADAHVALTVFYADREPVGPYRLTIAARRVRSVRCNDLIDPEALPLGVDYGIAIECDVPIVVQFSRVDTSQSALALMGAMAYPVDA